MIEYRGRRAAEVSNENLTVTVTVEGGHIARILHKQSGINPLWTPPWPTLEPSKWTLAQHPEYGNDSEAKLLCGIMGHNLCFDLFGSPSPEEAAAGMTVHGESSVVPYEITEAANALTLRAKFPQAQTAFERKIELRADTVLITETAENLSACDRPSAWTQHVTLGPPFLERGVTQFRAPGTRSKVIEADFAGADGKQITGAVFDWPFCPKRGGGQIDLRVYESAAKSAGFTTHLMDPHREHAFFVAFHPKTKLLFGYVWKRTDFPWLGRWEENHSRNAPPWNGQSLTLGMEFGASPMPETRRQMIERGGLFGMPGYRWIPAGQKVTVRYCAFARTAPEIPNEVVWDGATGIRFS